MNGARNKILAAAGLIIFLLIVALLAAHYSFPYRAAGKVLSDAAAASGLARISFEGPHPGLPFRYNLRRIETNLRVEGKEYSITPVDRVDLGVSPFGLIGGVLRTGFTARTARGQVEGSLHYGLTGDHDLALVIDKMDLPDFVVSGPDGKDGINGRLTGTMTVLGSGMVVPTGGQGELEITGGRVWGIQVPQFPLTEMAFDRLTAVFRFEPDKVLLDKVEVEGPDGGVSLTGQIRDFKRPTVSFTGSARLGPPDAPMATMNLQISGPLENPRVQIRNLKAPDLKKVLGM